MSEDSGKVYELVKVCADPEMTDCIVTHYHSALPPLSTNDALAILGAASLVFAVAWGIGQIYRVLFFRTR